MPDPSQNVTLTYQVPEPARTATKAVAATVTTAAGVLALAVTSIVDGQLSWDEGGSLIGAVITAAATIGAVWRVRNKPKP